MSTIYCSDIILSHVENFKAQISERLCGWADNWESVPAFPTDRDREFLVSRISLWQAVNTEVMTNGPMAPVKLFIHALQECYSKSKGVVYDGSQFRATMNQPCSVEKWEKKIDAQVVRTLIINGSISWRLMECEHNLETPEAFLSLQAFRSRMSKLNSLANYTCDLARELLE